MFVSQALAVGRSAVIIVPDIVMTPAFEAQLQQQLSDLVTYHSRLTPKQRASVWWQVRANRPLVVVGARSALTLPWQSLGAVIIDEEDDLSYKQDQAPAYWTRELAVQLAQQTGAELWLGSLSPSVEAVHLAQSPSYGPAVTAKLVDPQRSARGQAAVSFELWSAISETVTNGQVLLYAPNRFQLEVTEAVGQIPGATVELFAPDKLGPAKTKAMLGRYQAGRTNVLVGGYGLTHRWGLAAELVGAVGIDWLLGVPDYRSGERTFGILRKLSLVSKNRLFVQTSQPDHPAMAGLVNPTSFYESELAERRALNLPPFTTITRIVFTGDSEVAAKTNAEAAAHRLQKAGLDVSAGACPILQTGGEFRWQLLYRGDPVALRPHLQPHWRAEVSPLTLL